MRLNTLKLPVAFSSAVMASFLALAVSAQEAPQEPQEPAKPLTPSEMVKQGYKVVIGGAELSQTVSAHLRKATEDADMMRVTCLNDKLTQINGNVKTARTHLS